MHYQPTCSIATIKARAKLYQQIRQFFAERDVLEVETPILSHAGATDVHLSSIQAYRHIHGKVHTHYLQTSPEFAMKRLLASHSGAIYQICKVFRDHEHGYRHNSEFTMLEWYRPEFSLDELMVEVKDLLNLCLAKESKEIYPKVISYKQAFQDYLGINPLQSDIQILKQVAKQQGLEINLGEDRLAYMDLLFSHQIEPHLGYAEPLFLTDFPPEMASLAKTRIDSDGEEVAARFELYINGLELANAYDELIQPTILRQRFEQDNQQRKQLGLVEMPIDEYLLNALNHMPSCSGIALGIDRLLMIITHHQQIDQVITFPAMIA